MSIQPNETEIINEFAKNIDCLQPIYEELSEINFFEILKIDQMEIRHSNFLSWLLDPASPSGIGDKLLKRLLLFCAENNDKNPNADNNLVPVSIELMDLDDVVIRREHSTSKGKKNEKKKIDLLISSAEGKFCVCIENKIKSGEHTDQLSKYFNYVEEDFARKDTKYIKYKYDNRYYILLSPNGIEAEKDSDKENWIALSYAEIYDWIEELIKTYGEKIPARAKVFITDYLNALQRHVIDGQFKETCDRIYMDHTKAFAIFEEYKKKETSDMPDTSVGFKLYFKHKEAIDLVLDNRIELTERIKHRLIDAIKDKGYDVLYDPKRAPAFLKVPTYVTSDTRLADPTRDDISSDFLFFELYYAPGSQKYYVNLKPRMDLIPARFDSNAYGKEIKKSTLLASRQISKANKRSVADYIEELEKNPKEPSKGDPFIQELCNEVLKALHEKKFKDTCQNIINAIT